MQDAPPIERSVKIPVLCRPSPYQDADVLRNGHGYAVVGAYGCKGKAVIVEAGELIGAVDDLVPQIVELVKRHRVTSVACEKAGGGFVLMRTLNQGLANFGVNVEAIHHGNRSKWQRLEQELGGMALFNVLMPTASAWLPQLRKQFKAIATRHGNPKDDVADACLHGLEVVAVDQRRLRECD